MSLATATTATESSSIQGVTTASTQVPATLGQAVVPTVTDSASLTNQATQSVVATSTYSDPQTLLSSIANPYPSQVPVQLLSRQYKIAEFDFGAAFSTVRVPFPGALFAQPVIQAAMLSFPFWRGDIKVHVRMQAVPQQSGALLVSWLPCTNKANVTKIAASGNHATLLNVSTSDSCTFVIPYLSPKAWLTYPAQTTSDHSCLYFHRLVALSAPPTVSDSVHFTVFASIENPRVAGFKHVDVAQSGLQSFQKVVAAVLPAVESVADTAAKMAPMLNVLNLLDKPDLDPDGQYVVAGALRATEWLTDAKVPTVQMSLKSRPYLANTVNVFPLGKSADSFTTLASNPMLFYQKDFTAAGDVGGFPVNPCIPASDLELNFGPDYLFHFTRFASFWRGSIRFMMHFCTDQFTSARFRVGLSYAPWTAGWADSGDVPSTVVDVHGSTYFSLNVPYLHTEYWKPVTVPITGTSQQFPQLYIELLDAPVGANLPADPKITLSIFRSAGADFQLAEPGYNQAYVPPPPLAANNNSMKTTQSLARRKGFEVDVAQCSLDSAFSKSFSSIVEGVFLSHERGMCMAEEMDSPAQLCKRFLVPETLVDLEDAYDPASTPHHYLNLCADVFAFWRGSQRVAFNRNAETAYADVTSGYLIKNPISPSVREWTEADPQGVAVTLPFYSTCPYQVMSNYTYTGSALTDPVSWFADTTPTGISYRFAAGDDLVCGHLIAPQYQVTAPQ